MKSRGNQCFRPLRLRGGVPALCLLAGLICPASAHAHLVNSELGPFYDGIFHLLLSPDELLGVLGLALWAGLGGAPSGRWTLFTLPAAWLVGGMVGMRSLEVASFPAVTGLALVLLGLLVAWDGILHATARVGLAGLFGLFHGYLNGTVAAQGQLGLTGLLGIASTVFVCVALVSAAVVSLSQRPAWTRVAVRVAGSWIAAIGLLMVGWALRAS